ncbi:MAG: PAS domain S-box protein, partial [Gaiellaceae bacterium]
MTTTLPTENEARHRAILEAALDCVVTIDHAGRILEFNPAAERTFGFLRNEVMGERIGDLIVPERLRAAHTEGLARFLARGESTIIGKRIELPALCADGREIVVELAITRVDLPGLPVFTAYVRDISERRQAEAELRRSQELYRLVVENSKDLVGLVELDGRVVFASPSHREKLGYDPVTLVGGSLEAIIHPDDAGAVRTAFTFALEGTRGAFEGVRLKHSDGHWVLVDGAVSAIPAEETDARLLLLTAHDVSGRLEEERTRERREQAERDFVTNAAHDLRTPLTAIAAAVEVLQKGAKR